MRSWLVNCTLHHDQGGLLPLIDCSSLKRRQLNRKIFSDGGKWLDREGERGLGGGRGLSLTRAIQTYFVALKGLTKEETRF